MSFASSADGPGLNPPSNALSGPSSKPSTNSAPASAPIPTPLSKVDRVAGEAEPGTPLSPDEQNRAIHSAIDSISDYAIILLSERGTVQTWNAGAERICGYAAQDIVGRPFDWFYPLDQCLHGYPQRILRDAMDAGHCEDEGWLVRKNKSSFFANLVVTLVSDANTASTGYVIVIRDLTERRAAEQQLRILQQGIDSISDYAIFLLDPNGLVKTWNKGAERIKGYHASEIIGRSFSVFYTPESRAADLPRKVLEDAVRNGHFSQEGWRIRKDGSRFYANVLVTPAYSERGAVLGFVKVTRDLTEKRNAEERVRVLQRGIDCITDYAIFLLDPEGKVATWNSGAQRIKGYSASDIIGQSFSRFYPIEAQQQGLPRQILAEARTRGHFEDEGIRVRKDGSHFWANVIITPILDELGQLLGFVKVTRDLTERRKAEAVEENRKRLVKYIDMFTHGLRNPLMGIIGSNNFIRKDVQQLRRTLDCIDDDPIAAREAIRGLIHDIEEQTEAISACAQHSTVITNDVLDLSRIEAHSRHLENQPLRLQEVVENLEKMFKGSVREKGLQLKVNVPPHDVYARADKHCLEQILNNLMTNAVKFTRTGSITVSLSILSASNTEILAQFQVDDTGIGMSEADTHKIFNRFEQVSSWITHNYGGSGLGLYISRQLVLLMGGSIWVNSQPGQGSSFVFTARLAPLTLEEECERLKNLNALRVDQTKSAATGKRTQPEDEKAAVPLRVLIVEDNTINQKIMSKYLQARGHRFDIANNGREAVERASENEYDVILMDVEMPEMNGLEATRCIRRMHESKDRTLAARAVQQNLYLSSRDLSPSAFSASSSGGLALSHSSSSHPNVAIVSPNAYPFLANLSSTLSEASVVRSLPFPQLPSAAEPLPRVPSGSSTVSSRASSQSSAVSSASVGTFGSTHSELRRLGEVHDDLRSLVLPRAQSDTVFHSTVSVTSSPRLPNASLPTLPLSMLRARRPRIIGLSGNARPEQREAALSVGMDGYLTKPYSREQMYQVIEQTDSG